MTHVMTLTRMSRDTLHHQQALTQRIDSTHASFHQIRIIKFNSLNSHVDNIHGVV